MWAYSILFFIALSNIVYAQTGIIKGVVFNAINNEPIPFASVAIQGTTLGTTADINGAFEIKNLSPNNYNVTASYIGFKSQTLFEVSVSNSKITNLNIGLEEDVANLQAIEIKASPFNKTQESPVSLRTINSEEIQRNPGGNRDISKVIQSLPGVSSTVSFRNDIIIRGGSPNENRFYLDGIEVPNINHFATQGASGGPVGMINVNFINEVNFYSGAFPANRGNALSSVFDFKQKDGNPDKLLFTSTLGSSDFGITLDGPLGKKTTYIFSARRSYLQFLFAALELPFLPTYNDFQFKFKIKLNQKNEITVIGLGAIDQFELNLDANETEQQQYILGYLPENEQWNYTLGVNYKHFRDRGNSIIVASRNHLKNNALKYQDNDYSSLANKILDYTSQEIENKVRLENNQMINGFKLNYGIGYENVIYTNSTFNKIALQNGYYFVDFDSKLNFNKYSLFGQISKDFFQSRLSVSLGLRTDFNDYSIEMYNPLKQISPRFSVSYSITEKLFINFNAGRYYQLPPYTVLGYRDSLGNLINKQNAVTYISCDHIVAGLEYNFQSNLKFTVEGFYKIYNHYPFILSDSISLANLGGDFGVVGNTSTSSTSQGQSFGIEFLAQQKLYKGFYGIISCTLVKSEFKDRNEKFVPSTWDSGLILSLTLGKKFKKNWELGFKWRLQGGSPYTPYDIELSSLKSIWDITKQGILNYDSLNTKRLPSFHQLDFRIDKKYFFKKWSFNIYLDIQNAYNAIYELNPILNVEKDTNGNLITDPNNSNAYQTTLIDNTYGNLLPSIGIIIEL